jgi:hypothetical protein
MFTAAVITPRLVRYVRVIYQGKTPAGLPPAVRNPPSGKFKGWDFADQQPLVRPPLHEADGGQVIQPWLPPRQRLEAEVDQKYIWIIDSWSVHMSAEFRRYMRKTHQHPPPSSSLTELHLQFQPQVYRSSETVQSCCALLAPNGKSASSEALQNGACSNLCSVCACALCLAETQIPSMLRSGARSNMFCPCALCLAEDSDTLVCCRTVRAQTMFCLCVRALPGRAPGPGMLQERLRAQTMFCLCVRALPLHCLSVMFARARSALHYTWHTIHNLTRTICVLQATWARSNLALSMHPLTPDWILRGQIASWTVTSW